MIGAKCGGRNVSKIVNGGALALPSRQQNKASKELPRKELPRKYGLQHNLRPHFRGIDAPRYSGTRLELLLFAFLLLPAWDRARSEDRFAVSPLVTEGTGQTLSTAPSGTSPGKPQSPPSGYVRAPWIAKTSARARLQLQGNDTEIRADYDTHFALTPTRSSAAESILTGVPPPEAAAVVRSTLKTQLTKHSPPTRISSALLLHRGCLGITKNQATGKATVLLVKTASASCIIRSAKASLKCDLWGNTRICVYEGDVHVHPSLRRSFTLRAGQTVLLESALPPSRGLLSEFPEALEQRRLIDALNSALPSARMPLEGDFSSPPQSLSSSPPDLVGSGALVPFDLKARRGSVLLQPASPDVSTPQDVSPELPLPQ